MQTGKFANFARLYYFRILQHFATKFWNFTTFKMFFQGISFFSSRLYKKLVYNVNRPFVTETFTQRRSECKFYIHIIYFFIISKRNSLFRTKVLLCVRYFLSFKTIFRYKKWTKSMICKTVTESMFYKTWTQSIFYESSPCFSSPVLSMFYNMP